MSIEQSPQTDSAVDRDSEADKVEANEGKKAKQGINLYVM